MRSSERAWWAREPPDPDLPLPQVRTRAAVLVIATGGVLGALARYAAGELWPTPSGTFGWTTLLVNVVGCLAMGVLMVALTERSEDLPEPHPLLRPFFGTGVLGGFTTFSTYAVDAQGLLDHGHALAALAYLALTLVAAIAAVWVGVTLARRVLP